MKKNVAVIMGGYSSEHDISVLSGTTVFNHIDKNLFNAYKVIIDKNNWNLITKDGINHSLSKDQFSCDVNGIEIKFDIIECSGVLHHMKEPNRGLDCLLDCLEKNGFLKLALMLIQECDMELQPMTK